MRHCSEEGKKPFKGNQSTQKDRKDPEEEITKKIQQGSPALLDHIPPAVF